MPWALAEESREVGVLLPPKPLDEAVHDLGKRLRALRINTFGTEHVFPDLPTFQSDWNETYAGARRAIDRVHTVRREEAERAAAKVGAERAKGPPAVPVSAVPAGAAVLVSAAAAPRCL